jgi:hypothetical protein
VLLFLMVSSVQAATPWSNILVSSQAIDWSQVGVQGGIPNRTTICSTINASIYGNGSTDATAGIQNALNACPAGQVVYLSAGTFLIDSYVTVPSSVTLRGAGANQTILNAMGSGNGASVVNLGSASASPNISGSQSITSGATAGSTSLVVSNAAGITAGMYLIISELNDPSFVSINGSEGPCTWCDGGLGWNGTRVAGQIVQVTSVSGTTLGISPALYMNYPLTPLATPFTANAVYAGVENLQVYANNTGYGSNFMMNMCADCWISGVEGNYADGDHVQVSFSYRGQIQNSYFSNAFVHGPGSYDSDITLYNKSSGMLVQNNILERLHVSIMLEWGAAGNVLGYNYTFGNYASGSTTFGPPGMNTHGAHPMYNLWEGNITENFDLDSIWGSHSDNTAFRNWSKGTTKLCSTGTSGRSAVTCADTWSVQYIFAMDIDFLGSSYNLVGNVLGSQDLANLTPYNSGGSPIPEVNEVVALCGPSPCGAGSRSYDQTSYIHALGFGEASDDGTGGTSANAGCSGTDYTTSCHSLIPYSTLFVHGDYSSATGAVTWASGVTQTLPASFYLSAEPSWFGSVPWPAIGPDVTGGLADAYGHAYAIPAEVCYEQVMGGTDGTGSPLSFNAETCYGASITPPPPVISTFTATPAFMTSGQSSTLSWTVSNATTVVIDNGIGNVTATTFTVVSPAVTTTYNLTAWGLGGGPVSQTTTITVTAPVAPWSGILDPSRAIDWSNTGFTIPNYTAPCATQPTLTANDSSAAAANTTAIQNALASCDATHNVVNIPAGTYYVNGWTYPSHGHQVVRGAGPNSTTLILVGDTASCNQVAQGICIGADTGFYWGDPRVLPGGSNSCSWSAGYAQGTNTITLSSCGSAPPNNAVITLDQANDSTDSGGVFICDDSSYANCNFEGSGNANGRIIGGITHSEQQSTLITNVTSLGGGSYSVTISPGVYFTNIRSSQSPGAWWSGYGPNAGMNNGLENLSIDQTTAPDPPGFFNCYQCWIKNIRSMYGGRSHVNSHQSFQGVIRDSYFYQGQNPGATQSYGIEFEIGPSAFDVENNIFEQVTAPIMFGQGSGNVIGYNFMINNQEGATNMGLAYFSHNAGNEMNLWEGNNFNGVNSDDSWGASTQGTFFRNMISGWQLGKNQYTYAVSLEAWARAFNFIGNVLGQPGYDITYESYATSTTGGVNGGDADNTSIYSLGWTGISGWGGCSGPPVCGPLVRPTLMRWGNWDVVHNATQWDSTEASPAAVPYVNANFTSSYFDSLGPTLPASLYYSAKPFWWPAGKAWPAIGPDVTTGNIGLCTGTYAGTQATTASQCTANGGTGTLGGVQYASHLVSIPAQDCFLSLMGGPPDGSGNVLPFDAAACYGNSSSQPPPPPPSTNASAFSPQVYPNPWRSDKHTGKNITFDGLTTGTDIKIFTVSGHKVAELHTDGPNIPWTLTNDAGDKVASGIYLYLITDTQGDKAKGKVAVIK